LFTGFNIRLSPKIFRKNLKNLTFAIEINLGFSVMWGMKHNGFGYDFVAEKSAGFFPP